MRNYFVLIILSLLFTQSAFAVNYQIQLNSDPGDYIGQGINRTLSPDNSSLYVVRSNSWRGVDIYIEPNDETGMWHFNFNGANSVQLIPDNYENADRYGLGASVTPSMSASGDYRGCNVVAGRFIVREIVYDVDNNPISFAIDFEQHCDRKTEALWGYIRYNSNVPFVVPEPNAAAGADSTYDETTTVQLDGSNSSDGNGSINSYQWTQISGPAAQLLSQYTATTDVVLPDVVEGGDDLIFQLEVMDNDGLIDADILTLHVQDEYDPHSMMYVKGEEDNGIMFPGERTSTINDSTFRATRDINYSVKIEHKDTWHSNLAFAAPGNAKLEPGKTYNDATRYPFQLANEPGLDYSRGVGCNQSIGNFTVWDVRYDDNYGVNSFAADFEQWCEGASGAVRGTILYNYRKPKPFPVMTLTVKDNPDPAKVRSLLTYTLDIRNEGGVAATNVYTETSLPSRAVFISASSGCEFIEPVVKCELGTLKSLGHTTVDIIIKPKRKGTNTAITTVKAAEIDPQITIQTDTIVSK